MTKKRDVIDALREGASIEMHEGSHLPANEQRSVLLKEGDIYRNRNGYDSIVGKPAYHFLQYFPHLCEYCGTHMRWQLNDHSSDRIGRDGKSYKKVKIIKTDYVVCPLCEYEYET